MTLATVLQDEEQEYPPPIQLDYLVLGLAIPIGIGILPVSPDLRSREQIVRGYLLDFCSCLVLGELEIHYLIRLQSPCACQVKISVSHSINPAFRLEPASLATGSSSGYFTASDQRLQHPSHIVVTSRRFLSLVGA